MNDPLDCKRAAVRLDALARLAKAAATPEEHMTVWNMVLHTARSAVDALKGITPNG